VRSGAAIHGFGRQDYELPDRVFATYVSRHGHAFIDRALYLPKDWTDDPDRLEAAYVPADVGFATKTKTCDENDRTRDSRVCAIQVGCRRYRLRCWRHRTATTSSRQRLRAWGQQRSCVSILGKRPPVAGTAADIARTRRSSDWKRLSAGAGTKGPRLHDWCYLELADLEAEPFNSANDGLWTRGLLIRRHIADGDLAFFTTWCPAGTSIETLVAVEGHRWAIEDSFETAKNEFGLDHNESRSWHGWHRHVSLVMLAFAMMAAIDIAPIRRRPKKRNVVPRQKPRHSHATLIRWSIQEIRRIAIRLARNRIQPAHIIAWSLWRRAHQAAAQRAHFKAKRQL